MEDWCAVAAQRRQCCASYGSPHNRLCVCARALCRKNGYDLSYNQEIVGLGVANFAGAMFSSYTTTGSFSRSAVNNSSGGWCLADSLLQMLAVRVPLNTLQGSPVGSVRRQVKHVFCDSARYTFAG